MMKKKNKESWLRKFKNHIQITKLAMKIGYNVSIVEIDSDKLKDENKKKNIKAEIEEIKIEDNNFNGDDGSTENLERYKEIFTRLELLKQKINNDLT